MKITDIKKYKRKRMPYIEKYLRRALDNRRTESVDLNLELIYENYLNFVKDLL
jgi:hypothetical protein